MRVIVLGMLLVFAGFVAADEHVMVWTDKVDVYNEKGKLVAVFPKGKFLQVSPHSKDLSRYTIIIKKKKYNIRKRSVKSIGDVAIVYKKKILDFSAEINKNDLRFSNINSELVGMYVQGLELERDTSLSYMKVSTVTRANGQIGQYRGFSTMLSDGKFKKLKKVWTADMAELFAEKAGIITKNQKYMNGILKLKRKIQNFENLGALLAVDSLPGNIDKQLFVIGRGAELYQKNKIVKLLKPGTKLMGYKHKKFHEWYDVRHDGDNYMVSSTSVVEVSLYKSLLASKIITLEYKITQLEQEVEMQQFRLKLYQGISRQLQADKFISNGYGLVKDLVVPIDKNRTFTIVSPAADRVYVNIVRAGKVLRIWKTEALDLVKKSLHNQKLMLSIKKGLLDLDVNLKKMN